jgi:hypothetical protein
MLLFPGPERQMVEWIVHFIKQEALGNSFPPIISLCTKKTLGIINVRSDRMSLLKTRMSKKKGAKQGLPFFMPSILKLLIILTKNSLHFALGYTFKKLFCSKNNSRHFFIHIQLCIALGFVSLKSEKAWPQFFRQNNSIIGFHLLDGDTYYFAYYRRVWPMKECHKLRKEYMGLLKNHATVRIVIDHPNESTMAGKSRKEWPSPFNKAKKMISGPFIRLQASDKCKAYFSEDCDLPKNYWGGVTPEK